MITYLKGILEYISDEFIIIDVNNIGYKVFISSYTLTKLPVQNENIKIYTYMNIREDAILLYGFLEIDELNMFNMLIGVSGIGPKAALSILSNLRPQDISMAVIMEDINTLSKTPGIGKKTAQRIILDLKDKLKTVSYNESIELDIGNNQSSSKQDAIDALVALGYSQIEAVKVVKNVYSENMNIEDIIKLALKKLAKI